jgi:hypothetical protein
VSPAIRTFTESEKGISKYALWPAVEPFSSPVFVTEKYLLVKPSFPVALDMTLARDMKRFPNLPRYRVVPSTLIVHMALGGASMNQDLTVPPEELPIVRLRAASTHLFPARVPIGPASSGACPRANGRENRTIAASSFTCVTPSGVDVKNRTRRRTVAGLSLRPSPP